MATIKRKKLFVDKEVQGAIIKRVLFYWCACFLFLSLPIWVYESLSRPDQMFYEHIGPMFRRFMPVYITLILILPFVIYDALRLSNRFCGPLRRVMNELEAYPKSGGTMKKITFRDNDFWQSLADSITSAVNGGNNPNDPAK